jgi:hypothetical protein
MEKVFCKKWTHRNKKGAIIFFEGSYMEDYVKENEVNVFVCNEFLGTCVSYAIGRGCGHLYESVYGDVQEETFVIFPETKVRPSEIALLGESLLLMQRLGSAVFSITLSYSLCKYLDLKRTDKDKVFFHTFKKITKEEAKHLYYFTSEFKSFDDFCDGFDGVFYKHNKEEYFKNIKNNEIVDAFIQLYHDEVDKEL